MSYPYPQDRHRDRKEKGEQPYKDAREAMSQSEADIQAEEEAFGEAHLRATDEERAEEFKEEIIADLRRIGDERARTPESDAGTTNASPSRRA